MRRLLALVAALAMVAAACGGDSTDATSDGSVATTTIPATTDATSATPTSGAPPATTAQTASGDSHPLVIAAIDFDAGTILLRNDGVASYDLSGHWLCNRPNYASLPQETLEPGGIIEIDAAALGVAPNDGELGVYTSRDFGSAAAIVRYVEWGEAGHGRSATATEAGIWADGEFVANDGANIESSTPNPTSAADWVSN